MLSTRTLLRFWLALSLGAGLSTAVIAGGAAAPNMQVLQHWKLGGAGGWDYLTVDSAGIGCSSARRPGRCRRYLKSGKLIGSHSRYLRRPRHRAGSGVESRLHQQRAREHRDRRSISTR